MKREEITLEPITVALIQEIQDKIIECINPYKIILFGSVIKGYMESAHDIDMYVIKEGIEDVRKAEREIDELFEGRLFALDVIVRTPRQLERSLAGGNTFLQQEVMTRGKVVYDRHRT